MTDHTLTVTMSDELYSRLQQISDTTAQPLEDVLVQQLREALIDLSDLPDDEQTEYATFKYLSDATLRTIAREQMPQTIQNRMVYLGDRHSRRTITPPELSEYTALVQEGEKLILRKAWAAGVLMDRGYPITSADMAA